MKQKTGFTLRQVCGEHVITATGMQAIDFSKLLHLNDTAAFLWEEAERQGDFTAESLAAVLCKEYEVDEKQAKTDCESIIRQWEDNGLLEH